MITVTVTSASRAVSSGSALLASRDGQRERRLLEVGEQIQMGDREVGRDVHRGREFRGQDHQHFLVASGSQRVFAVADLGLTGPEAMSAPLRG